MEQPNSKSKLPNNLTEEELFQILKEDNTEVKEEDIQTDDVLNYISFFNIKDGNNRIRPNLLYKLYSNWSKAPITKPQFIRRINFYLTAKGSKTGVFYLLNQEALTLSKRLFKLIESQTQHKTKIPNYKRHFESFIKHYNLSPGDKWVQAYILYYLYDKWHYSTKAKNRLGYNQFFNFCLLYFPNKRITSSRVIFFKVDVSIFQSITQEEINQIQKAKFNEASKRAKKGKETNPKK